MGTYKGSFFFLGLVVAMFLCAMAVGHAAAPQRRLGLTLGDVIDTLSDYQVTYDSSDEFCSTYAGLTDAYHRRITLCGQMDLGWRRATIIHEMLHAASGRRPDRLTVPYTEDEIKEAVERIYGEAYK